MAKKKKRSTLKRGDCAGCGLLAKQSRGGKLCCKWCAKLTLSLWEGACIEWARIKILPETERGSEPSSQVKRAWCLAAVRVHRAMVKHGASTLPMIENNPPGR